MTGYTDQDEHCVDLLKILDQERRVTHVGNHRLQT